MRLTQKAISVMLVSVISCIMSSCTSTQTRQKSVHDVTGEFQVSVLKVGQADAIVLKTQNHSVVIDCGEKDDGDKVLEYLSDHGIDRLDYLFITHFDKDHVGGVPEIMENVEIEQIITPDYEGSNSEYKKYCEAVKSNSYEPLRITKEMSFNLDDILFEVYPPLDSEYDEGDNDFSIVIGVTHGENKFLFTGDAEAVRIDEILTQTDGEYDFLKVPHHGRYDKKTKEFFEKVNPEYAVITCSEKNPADESVVKILEDLGCTTYFTSAANVEAVSDGKKIKIFQ